MIIPTHCQTCGKPIAHLWFRYLNKVRQFQQKKTENMADSAAAISVVEADSRTPEAHALDDLLIHKYCCRRSFLCQPEDLVGMIRNRIE